MDQFWDAVADFLNSASLAGRAVVAPLELREIFPVWHAYGDVMAADADRTDALVLHKARYHELGRNFMRAALSRLRPGFANEVFIVLTADCPALDAADPHLGNMRAISLWADAEDDDDPRPQSHQVPVDMVLRRIALSRWWDELRSAPRARDPLRLTRFGRKSFSQNDEDGIILEIFNRIGVTGGQFVEFGVEAGTQCNTALLLSAGWSGLWLDGSPKNIAGVNRNHRAAIAAGRLTAEQAMVTAENIDTLIGGWRETHGGELDLLSIDIDFNDYWIWRAIEGVRPRVVVIEYNASYPPPLDFVVPYDPAGVWNTTNYCGASLSMLEKLGLEKGYALVGCCLAGVNAFFVRDDQLAGPDGRARFHAPFTAAEHYEPPRYELCDLGSGHKPGFGPNAAVNDRTIQNGLAAARNALKTS